MDSSVSALKQTEYIEASALVVIGLLFSLFSGFWSGLIGIIFSVFLIVLGGCLSFNCIMEKNCLGFNIGKFICGLALLVFGLYCLFNFNFPTAFFSKLIGCVALVYAVMRLIDAVGSKKQDKNYMLNLVDGIINLVFGLIMLLAPFNGIGFLIMIFGIYLIYLGIVFFVIIKNSKFDIV